MSSGTNPLPCVPPLGNLTTEVGVATGVSPIDGDGDVGGVGVSSEGGVGTGVSPAVGTGVGDRTGVSRAGRDTDSVGVGVSPTRDGAGVATSVSPADGDGEAVGISVSLAVRDGDSVGTGVSSAYGTGLVANGVSVGDAVEGCVVGVPVEHAANASTSPLTVTNLVNNTLASWWHQLQDFSMAETSMSVTAYV